MTAFQMHCIHVLVASIILTVLSPIGVKSALAFQSTELAFGRSAEVKRNRKFTSDTSSFAEGVDGSASIEGEAVDQGDDDDEGVIPYMDRTLAWTKRYRRLVPYDNARWTAMRLGLRSKEDWDEIREFGKAFQGAHSVARPDIMYAKEWVSWEEFLGVSRPYEEAKDIVQNQLHLKSMDEYRAYVNEDKKRAELMRIPAKPEIVYRNKGWSESDFFGVLSSTVE